MRITWHLPSVCKECGASFEPRPKWIVSAIFAVSTALAILAIVAVRLATKAAFVLLLVGVIVTFVLFNVFQIVLFHMGVLRLTNINALEDLPVSLSPNDPNALAKAEEMVRSKNLAGSTKAQRVAQAQQLKESIELAKSLRGGEAAEQAPQPNPKPRSRARSAGVRCRFVRLSASNEAGIKRMSALATHIVRECFDSIVGSEQNDYMVARYESPKAIARQLADGFEYYFVLPPKRADEERGTARPIGLVSVRDQGDGELCLNKFYLVKGARGKGCARSMMRLAIQRARKLGCDRVTLRVNRDNSQAIRVFEHLGFEKIGEQRVNIGSGFVLNNLVYELTA